MTNVTRIAATVALSLAVFAAVPAAAFDRMISVDPKTFHDDAGKSAVTLHDAIGKKPVNVDLHDKTLGNVQPGDEVHLDGEPHTVTSVNHELTGSQISGFGFAIASILKFKAHKDNPTKP